MNNLRIGELGNGDWGLAQSQISNPHENHIISMKYIFILFILYFKNEKKEKEH